MGGYDHNLKQEVFRHFNKIQCKQYNLFISNHSQKVVI